MIELSKQIALLEDQIRDGGTPLGEIARRRGLLTARQVRERLAQYGAADAGIAGKDVILEHGSEGLYQPVDLGIGRCRISVAMPAGAEDNANGGHIRVATKYPHVTARHFEARGVQAECVKLNGAMELAPSLGLSGRIARFFLSSQLTPLIALVLGGTVRRSGVLAVERVAQRYVAAAGTSIRVKASVEARAGGATVVNLVIANDEAMSTSVRAAVPVTLTVNGAAVLDLPALDLPLYSRQAFRFVVSSAGAVLREPHIAMDLGATIATGALLPMDETIPVNPAHIADMQAAGRARRETDDRGHGGAAARGAVVPAAVPVQLA